MKRFPPLVRAIVAGALAALITSTLFLALDLTGMFRAIGVPMAAPPNFVPWYVEKIAEGAIVGMIFLIPLAMDVPHRTRGLVIGLLPAARLYFWTYPTMGIGLFGIRLGFGVVFFALLFSLLLGFLTGWLLDRWELGGPLAERLGRDGGDDDISEPGGGAGQ